MKFLLDENVARSVGDALVNQGHDVLYASEMFPPATPDVAMCEAALAHNAIVVAHDRDMKALSRTERFATLSFVRLCCNEASAAARMVHLLDLVEHEWMFASQKATRRLFVEIHQHAFRTHR